jgi:hypothetical protein
LNADQTGVDGEEDAEAVWAFWGQIAAAQNTQDEIELLGGGKIRMFSSPQGSILPDSLPKAKSE